LDVQPIFFAHRVSFLFLFKNEDQHDVILNLGYSTRYTP